MDYKEILSHFNIKGTITDVYPLGNGLINITLVVKTAEDDCPDYVLQRINDEIFTDVDLLQRNIENVTAHIRKKLQAKGADDIDRKVLSLVETDNGKTYYHSADGFWRVTVFIPRSETKEIVTPETSYLCGKAFGDFQSMLADIREPMGESIPDFHNMTLRLRQLNDAITADVAGRMEKVKDIISEIENRAEDLTLADRLVKEGKLPRRICHCDTKVNNMLFDAETDKFLCVIDLDTVMPSTIFSDYGDFLRTAANTTAEDDPDTNNVHFRTDIFKAFTDGYMESAKPFITDIEVDMLPYAVRLFPYMQAVRFLTDYINGDTYYKTSYPEHNLDRTRNQMALLKCVEQSFTDITNYIKQI